MPCTRLFMHEGKNIFSSIVKHRSFVPVSVYIFDNYTSLHERQLRLFWRPFHSGISLNTDQTWGVSKLLTPSHCLCNSVRGYTRKRSKSKADSPSDSDSDSNDDDDDEEIDSEDEADYTDHGGSVMKLHVRSLRTDSILSKGMNTGREKIDKMFLANRLRVNGNVLLKKSKQLAEGDCVDMILQNSEDETKVKRLKVLKVLGEKTRTDKHVVKVQVWRKAFDPTSDEHSL
ncbi:mitochondrial transcription rescue factor 1-like [Haliotis asinina]|uniref:mitochondrial transcription rescue factor 1-like n=1 Tax=Haliotis asinina TaxID=109174 RepID=UPI003531F3CE